MNVHVSQHLYSLRKEKKEYLWIRLRHDTTMLAMTNKI